MAKERTTSNRWLVVKWDGQREVGVTREGEHCDPDHAPLMGLHDADLLAFTYGGTVVDESSYFGS